MTYCVLATTSDNTGKLISYVALSQSRTLADGESLQEAEIAGDGAGARFLFAVFPRAGGRTFEPESDDDLLRLGSLVPGCAVYADILPVIAVVGPLQEYLQPPDGSMALPFRVAWNEGVYILQNETQGDLWYEKFTFKSYFDQKKADITLTLPGKYKIYVWEPMGRTGDYVLELGYVEVFGFREIMRSLFWIEHLVNDGEIGCDLCRRQLKDLDGPNPTLKKVIEFYSTMFR